MNQQHLQLTAIGTDSTTAGKLCRTATGSVFTLMLCACSLLSPSATPLPAFYTLSGSPAAAKPGGGAAAGAMTAALSPTSAAQPAQPASAASAASVAKLAAATLIVNPPRAAAGFDSQRIIYLREAYKLEYFANSEWVDPPSRMLGTLLVSALQATGGFRAVVLAPGTAVGEIRLETEIIRLQQDFQTRPSRAQFTLRATLLDDKTRRVLAWREFDASVPAPTDDPYGGVLAANLAVQAVLKEMVGFCEEQVRKPRGP